MIVTFWVVAVALTTMTGILGNIALVNHSKAAVQMAGALVLALVAWVAWGLP